MFEHLKGRVPGIIDDKKIRTYAVTVPLIPHGDTYSVLFQLRASHLERQPGEICFPGGMREGGESAEENAVRETCEELLLTPSQVHVIAQMDTLLTSYYNHIDVFLCELSDYAGSFDTSEVAEVFEVPLSFFLEQEPFVYRIERRVIMPEDFPFDKIPGGKNYGWKNPKDEICFYEYDGRVIWGITAGIMRSVAKILKKNAHSATLM